MISDEFECEPIDFMSTIRLRICLLLTAPAYQSLEIDLEGLSLVRGHVC